MAFLPGVREFSDRKVSLVYFIRSRNEAGEIIKTQSCKNLLDYDTIFISSFIDLLGAAAAIATSSENKFKTRANSIADTRRASENVIFYLKSGSLNNKIPFLRLSFEWNFFFKYFPSTASLYHHSKQWK